MYSLPVIPVQQVQERVEKVPDPPFVNVVFRFTHDQEPFGFVPIGSRVCEMVKGSIAEREGVKVGWHVGCVDGRPLSGAVTGLRRCIPEVTTEEVKAEMRLARLLQMGENGCGQVCIAFWTRPTPYVFPRDNDGPLEANSVSELKRILVEKYGSVVTAWNMLLDTDASGTISYEEFLVACRSIGFEGSLKRVYDELDKDGSNEISLNELDPNFSFDGTQGRCVVCTLPNPCEAHSEKTQKNYLMVQRNKIAARAADAMY